MHFGSGGRFQACISVRSTDTHVLLDCGASSLVALKRLGLEPISIDGVIVSHLHGDHFGGIPFLVLDQQFAHRERPLWIAGPASIAERVNLGMEVFFPGSTRAQRSFECRFSELRDRERIALGGASVTGFEVVHASGAPAYGLRLECGGTTIAYSGDTAWTDALVDLARGADLFICEAYTLEKQIRYHLSYAALAQHRHLLECRRVALTHLGPDMLEHRSDIDVDVDLADDGLTLTF